MQLVVEWLWVGSPAGSDPAWHSVLKVGLGGEGVGSPNDSQAQRRCCPPLLPTPAARRSSRDDGSNAEEEFQTNVTITGKELWRASLDCAGGAVPAKGCCSAPKESMDDWSDFESGRQSGDNLLVLLGGGTTRGENLELVSLPCKVAGTLP